MALDPVLRREVATIRALHYLDLIGTRAVTTWAGERMAGDADFGALASLCDLDDPRREDVALILEEVAQELQLPPLTREMAAVDAAKDTAMAILHGEVSPGEGALRIWRIARLVPSAEPRLRVFIGLGSVWGDDPETRDFYEEQIRSEALALATEKM